MVDPAVLAAALAALAAAVLALADGYSHWTVPAIGPWAVAGAAVHVAARTGAYDGLRPPVRPEFLLPAVALLAAVTWLVATRIAAVRGVPYRERYLAAAGTGLAVTIVAALLVDVGVSATELGFVIAVPLAAAVVGTAGFLAGGFLVASLFTDLRVAGLCTVVTVVFEAVAAAGAAHLFGPAGRGLLVEWVREAHATAAVSRTGWSVIAGQLAVALVVVFACGRIARWRPDAGRAAVLVVSVVTLWSGTAVLLSAVALG